MKRLRYLIRTRCRVLLLHVALIVVACSASDGWIEEQVFKNNVLNNKTIIISRDFVFDLPFVYVCFLESEVGNLEKFKSSTKIIFRKNTGEEIPLSGWFELLRKEGTYICADYAQNYGVETHFNHLEITSDDINMISKVFWGNSEKY